MRSVSFKKITTVLAKYLVELLIVFIGVFSAYKLTDYQSGVEKELRRQQIKAGLSKEIQDITFRAKRLSDNLYGVIGYYDSTIAVNAMPPLQPFSEVVRVRNHIWESALQIGGLELFEPNFIFELSNFYNSFYAGIEQINKLTDLSDKHLLPNLNQKPEYFYDTRTKKLKPEFQWYINGIKNLVKISEEIYSGGNAILQKLQS